MGLTGAHPWAGVASLREETLGWRNGQSSPGLLPAAMNSVTILHAASSLGTSCTPHSTHFLSFPPFLSTPSAALPTEHTCLAIWASATTPAI